MTLPLPEKVISIPQKFLKEKVTLSCRANESSSRSMVHHLATATFVQYKLD